MSGGEGEILQQNQKKNPTVLSSFDLNLSFSVAFTFPNHPLWVFSSNLSLFSFFGLLLWNRSTSYFISNSVFRSATLPRVLILSWQYVRDLVWTDLPHQWPTDYRQTPTQDQGSLFSWVILDPSTLLFFLVFFAICVSVWCTGFKRPCTRETFPHYLYTTITYCSLPLGRNV